MIVVVDNFFKNPYDLKNHSLKNDRYYFSDKSKRWPGKRCFEVPEIYQNYLLNKTKEYFKDESIKYGEVFFHQISSNDIMSGWAHYDEDFRYASIVYLNNTNKTNVGTEIYDYFWNTDYLEKVQKFRITREKYLQKNKPNLLERYIFSEECRKFNKNFAKQKVSIDLKFNRYVAYEATRLHSAQNMFGKMDSGRINLIAFYK